MKRVETIESREEARVGEERLRVKKSNEVTRLRAARSVELDSIA